MEFVFVKSHQNLHIKLQIFTFHGIQIFSQNLKWTTNTYMCVYICVHICMCMYIYIFFFSP